MHIIVYISIHEHALYSSHGVIIRDLCLARDDYHHPEHLLSYNEIKELIEYLCINYTPDDKIDLNIVLKCHGYVCFYVRCTCFLCSLWAFMCNYMAICHYIFVSYHIINCMCFV